MTSRISICFITGMVADLALAANSAGAETITIKPTPPPSVKPNIHILSGTSNTSPGLKGSATGGGGGGGGTGKVTIHPQGAKTPQ